MSIRPSYSIHFIPSSFFSDCLVLSDGETLIIGRIDDIQKLHMRCVPLGESPARIAHQPQTGTIAIITHRDDVREGEREKGWI